MNIAWFDWHTASLITQPCPRFVAHIQTHIKRIVFLYCHLTPEYIYVDSGHLRTGSLVQAGQMSHLRKESKEHFWRKAI